MDNIKANVQKLGRSMLVPVAAMPLAGLVLRFSSDDLLNIPLIGAAGNAVFGNLDMLFAIGVSLGFVKAKDKGIPALTAVLALLTLKAALQVIDPNIGMGIFAGIISGLFASWTYNRFKDQDLPTVLGFFAKERFPLTMIMIVMTVVALPLGLVWPFIQNGLDAFANSLISMGALGVGIFVFLNRLLIPFGLHHVLNTYIYFELGSFTTAAGEVVTGEIPRFLSGDPTAGFFLAGFFAVMMFGIPGICMATYKAAHKENKEMVKGAMVSGALTSFLTNITEPVEFSFMFVAPILYVVHSVLAGVTAIVAYLLRIRIGFSFGACLVDYIINFSIADRAILILPLGVGVFLAYYATFYFIITKYDYKTMGREVAIELTEQVSEAEKDLKLKSSNYEYMAKKIMDSLGGTDNVSDAFNCVTRLRVSVKDSDQVDVSRIKKTGVSGVIKTGPSDYQIIVGLEVSYLMEQFNKLMENQK